VWCFGDVHCEILCEWEEGGGRQGFYYFNAAKVENWDRGFVAFFVLSKIVECG